jgi:hypothetical protein
MSTQYVQSLRYNIFQCDWLLANIGSVGDEQDEQCQESIDFLHGLRDIYRDELTAHSVRGLCRKG